MSSSTTFDNRNRGMAQTGSTVSPYYNYQVHQSIIRFQVRCRVLYHIRCRVRNLAVQILPGESDGSYCLKYTDQLAEKRVIYRVQCKHGHSWISLFNASQGMVLDRSLGHWQAGHEGSSANYGVRLARGQVAQFAMCAGLGSRVQIRRSGSAKSFRSS